MTLKIQITRIAKQSLQAKNRIVINAGSSRSGKTYNLMVSFLIRMFQEDNILITVVRKTLPSVKATAYKDFLEIINKAGLYNPNNHNKSELTYTIGTNEIEFISVDDFNKIKGRKRDYLFCNEANELNKDEFTQLALRTTKQIFLDYNPSHSVFHWIETDIKTREDVLFIHSTYKDNPFLESEVVREIERLKNTDENLWRIYGLGLMGISKARVYSDWELVDEMPENYHNKFYGLDFGFNHPNALTEVREQDDEFYLDEKIYLSGQTIEKLIEKMDELGIDKKAYIYADSAYPAYIKQIRDAGYNCQPADKGKNSVKQGIDLIKSKKIYLTKRSINIQKENRSYNYKVDANGNVDDTEPVKFKDDAMDSIRYAIYSEKNKRFIGII